MIRALSLTACLLLCSFARPPEEFRGAAHVDTIFATPETVAWLCEMRRAPPGVRGCADEHLAILIHPTHWRMTDGDYAAYVEHELGHVSGWPKEHPR